MKSKKFLSGVTAAIMAFSSIAVASFTSTTSVSADEAPYSWTGQWQKEKGIIDAGTTVGDLKVEDWGSSYQIKVYGFDLSKMEDPTIRVSIANDTYQVWNENNTFADGVASGKDSKITDKTVTELLVSSSAAGVISKIEIFDGTKAPDAPPEPITTTTKPLPNEAFLMYCDQDWGSNWSTFKHPETMGTTAIIKGSGTYTVGVGPEMAITAGNKTASGITVMAVDISGYANAIGAGTADEGKLHEADARDIARKAGLNITNVSIIIDNKEVYKYDDKDVMFGDIEGNGNIRIDIYNTENESGKELFDGDYDAPQKVQDLADGDLEATENIMVKFTLTYNSSTKPASTTARPATSKSAKQEAENAMKKATIKKLKVNAKKAKKVTVTWKNIKKVNGYKIKGYEVQVSNKSGFGNKLLKKTVKKSKIVIKTNKKIKRGKKYFVRVRAYTTYKDAKGKTQKACGKWKKSAKFKVK